MGNYRSFLSKLFSVKICSVLFFGLKLFLQLSFFVLLLDFGITLLVGCIGFVRLCFACHLKRIATFIEPISAYSSPNRVASWLMTPIFTKLYSCFRLVTESIFFLDILTLSKVLLHEVFFLLLERLNLSISRFKFVIIIELFSNSNWFFPYGVYFLPALHSCRLC